MLSSVDCTLAAAAAFERAEDEPDHDGADRREDERADEALQLAVAELARQPAAHDRAEDPDDDRREATLDAARPDDPARDRAGQEADDDPADEIKARHRDLLCSAGCAAIQAGGTFWLSR